MLKKIKNFRPPKHLLFLYFFIPFLCVSIIRMDTGHDIWFLLKHGEYVLHHGFPTIEPFTMHQNFSFVMQQWLSAVIFYLSYTLFGKWGLLALCLLVLGFILFFLYRLCMLLSKKQVYLSVIITILTGILLCIFIIPRPQIFTYLILIITLYVLELYRQDKKSKAIYFLPLLSFFLINLHASMWFLIFLFTLPYVVEFSYLHYKKKDKRIYKLLILFLLMFFCGFLNPYGIKNMLYVVTSYGNTYINTIVSEMRSPSFSDGSGSGFTVYTIVGFIFLIYLLDKDGKIEVSHFFLFLGTTILAMCNLRNLPLFIIGSYPFLAAYLKDKIKDKRRKKEKINKLPYFATILLLFSMLIVLAMNSQKEFTSPAKDVVDYLLKHNKVEDIVLYNGYDSGSYCEYRGLKPYIDTRAEVFLKSNNKKKDIFKEYYLLYYGYLDYEKILNHYHFTHLIVTKTELFYDYLKKNKNYKLVYKGKKYVLFEKKETSKVENLDK